MSSVVEHGAPAAETPVQNETASLQYDWDYVLGVAKEHKPELIQANAIALLAAVAAVPVPLLIPLLVDEVLLDQPGTIIAAVNAITPASWHSPLLYVLSTLVLTFFLRSSSLALNVLQTRKFALIAKDVIYRMRRTLLLHLEKVSMSEYETLGSGTVGAYFITDLQTIDQFVGETVSKLLVAVLTIIGIAVILLFLHWQLALFILFANPVVIYFTRILGKHVKELKKRENRAFEIFQQSLVETLESIQQIRASNREKHYITRMIENAGEVKRHGSQFAWRSDAANRFSFVLFLFGIDIFRTVAILMVIFSDLTVGQMFAVSGYLWAMMGPVQEILNIQYAYYSANAAMGRINKLCELRQEPAYVHEMNPFADKQSVGIRIEDLHFAYGDGPDVLNGINLAIPAGEKIALVGASGGGKSTLVSVLIGLYPMKSGMVYYDNAPVSRIGLEVVREHVATVLQHPALFNDTVRANLTLGVDVGEDKLWQALEIAQLKETIKAQDAGLDTVVGRDGMRLSGGQKQRLAIARMVLTEPKVVILDEATSALDAETEYQLHNALSDFLKDRTTIIVAHRLSAIKQAGHVYVLESGVVSEEGSHEALLSQDGLYSKLYGVRQSAVGDSP